MWEFKVSIFSPHTDIYFNEDAFIHIALVIYSCRPISYPVASRKTLKNNLLIINDANEQNS